MLSHNQYSLPCTLEHHLQSNNSAPSRSKVRCTHTSLAMPKSPWKVRAQTHRSHHSLPPSSLPILKSILYTPIPFSSSCASITVAEQQHSQFTMLIIDSSTSLKPFPTLSISIATTTEPHPQPFLSRQPGTAHYDRSGHTLHAIYTTTTTLPSPRNPQLALARNHKAEHQLPIIFVTPFPHICFPVLVAALPQSQPSLTTPHPQDSEHMAIHPKQERKGQNADLCTL